MGKCAPTYSCVSPKEGARCRSQPITHRYPFLIMTAAAPARTAPLKQKRERNECGGIPLGLVDGNEIRRHEENVE
jgi:hypothetical protein